MYFNSPDADDIFKATLNVHAADRKTGYHEDWSDYALKTNSCLEKMHPFPYKVNWKMTLLKFTLKLKNHPEDLEKLSHTIDFLSGRVGMTKKCTCETNLVLEELFTNIIQHGCCDGKAHTITISIAFQNNMLTMRIEDDGIPFNPVKAGEPDRKSPLEDREIGGLGIFLAKQYTDDIRYERNGKKNIITLKKELILIPDKERVNGNH